VGFNAYRPGKIKPADIAMLVAAVVVVVAAILWVWLG
jgi:hypothetical protein